MSQRWRTIALLALAHCRSRAPHAHSPSRRRSTGFFPAGAARGQSLTVTMSGTFDHWPVKCWVDGAGIAIEAGPEKGKLAVRVAADARAGSALGPRSTTRKGRQASARSSSARFPKSSRWSRTTTRVIRRRSGCRRPPSTAVSPSRGDVDGFCRQPRSRARRSWPTWRPTATSARRWTPCSRSSRRPASCSPRTTTPSAATRGSSSRPRPERPISSASSPSRPTPDSSIRFAGGEAFIYRLTLTTGGFLDHAFPLAVSKECPTQVTVIGPNIGECDRGSDHSLR